MPLHREFFGAVRSGAGALGGFLGDVFGGARGQFAEPGFQAPAGGFGQRVGGFVGGLAERAVPFLFPTRGPKVLCIIGPCPSGTAFPDRGRLPSTSRRSVLRTIPKAPGTLGEIPVGPRLGAAEPTDIGRPAFGRETILAGLGLPEGEEAIMAGLAPLALAGGARIAAGVGRQLPGILGGLGLSELFGGGGGDVDLPFGGRFFNQTMAGVRAKSLVRLQNPVTGSDVWYRNVGRPILFAGDFATVKRVRKVAALARRRGGR